MNETPKVITAKMVTVYHDPDGNPIDPVTVPCVVYAEGGKRPKRVPKTKNKRYRNPQTFKIPAREKETTLPRPPSKSLKTFAKTASSLSLTSI